jgi:carbonic anhydrase/acetyltransferase-like protein (isoleucine patch superfamily)
MSVWEFEGKRPVIGEGSFVFPTADVIGDVVLGRDCYVGPGARIRGDYGRVVIGRGTAVEENVVIHARPGDVTRIGEMVTLGHGCIVHNAEIEDRAVIGMGAIVSDWTRIGRWAVVGEGAVVRNHQEIPEGRIAVGVPAKIIAQVEEEYKAEWEGFKRVYTDLARERYPGSLKKLG